MPPRRRKPPRAGALTELPPLKVIRSIILLQAAFYVVATILILFSALVFGQSFSFSLIFDWRIVRGDNTVGWTIGFVWLLTAFITVIPIVLLIARSRQVPDFALTIILIHLIITSFYTRALPTNILWWGLEAASAFLMVSLGVWACRYRELQPISFGLGTRKSAQPDANSSAQDDDHVRGGPRSGRSTGDGPSYEMVGLNNDSNV